MTFEDHKKSVETEKELAKRHGEVVAFRCTLAYLRGAKEAGASAVDIDQMAQWVETQLGEV